MVKIIGPLASHHASGSISAPRIYSSSLRNRQDREAPPAPPPPPPHDLQVTGTLTPDATGYYDQTGLHNGRPTYDHVTNSFYIWWQDYGYPGYNEWIIGPNRGDTSTPRFTKGGPDADPATGTYNPVGGATGIATVSIP